MLDTYFQITFASCPMETASRHARARAPAPCRTWVAYVFMGHDANESTVGDYGQG